MTQNEGKSVFGAAEHPWLDPVWRRIVLVIFCAGWTGMEYASGETTWAFIVGAITVYAAWAYLYAYKGPDHPSRKTAAETDESEG
ncbi:hypothetical protein [Roseibium aggregatum]|uniref:DUF3329 domain-containing protein n=1 Tax=Roseibium aggregatum TaxID=187304 RepID=A0A939J0G8_9HYPH|nr:hypothetical protein [Roseibium aggregatum]MBN9669268.1 hypothetical protein [Roseibium aggregatum]